MVYVSFSLDNPTYTRAAHTSGTQVNTFYDTSLCLEAQRHFGMHTVQLGAIDRHFPVSDEA